MKHLKAFLLFYSLIVSQFSYSATGFYTGEQISGLNKICYYRGTRGNFAITQRAASVCPPSADDGRGLFGSAGQNNNGGNIESGNIPVTGFLQGERTDGLLKICFYNSVRGTFTVTQSSASVCSPTTRK